MCGTPLGTGPSVETSCAARSKIQLIAIMPDDCDETAGDALIQRPNTMRIASTEIETASVATRRLAELVERVPELDERRGRSGPGSTLGSGIPNMPPNCPIATWTPTPVRKPTSTVREMKLARKPRRASRARTRKAAASSARRLARADPLRRVGCEACDAEPDDPGDT